VIESGSIWAGQLNSHQIWRDQAKLVQARWSHLITLACGGSGWLTHLLVPGAFDMDQFSVPCSIRLAHGSCRLLCCPLLGLGMSTPTIRIRPSIVGYERNHIKCQQSSSLSHSPPCRKPQTCFPPLGHMWVNKEEEEKRIERRTLVAIYPHCLFFCMHDTPDLARSYCESFFKISQ
jgi:hypothetical protein